jgi:hypothetical protein
MPKRDIPTNVENLLINNEPFEYAHLVKFERPFNPKDGEFRTGANRYVYLTDGARDISYDGNIYRAHRLQSVGNYSETTVARATNMSLTLSGEDLGLSYTFKGSQTGATLSAATTGLYDGSEEVDFVEAGFREGDKVKIVRTNGQNYSNGDSHRIFIISSFSNNNQAITLAVTGTDTDDSTLETISNQNLTMTLENEELSGATLDRGVNASNPLFTNREVFVHKIFFDAEGVEKGAVQIFKGIIASTSISEAPTGSRVKWGLTSHWGDFVQVGGRLTLDEVHRSLDSNGKPSIDSAIKPSYATDLGFQHAETSLNTIANYKTTETRTVYKEKRRGGVIGMFGGKKGYTVEEQYEVDHQVDLNVHLKGRHLPVVYGVQRVPGIPVFADTKNNNSKEVYVAYALAEGKIQGLYNMYFEGSPIICTDQSDFEVRNAVNGTERAETQLQCYGRADRGDTLSGSALTGAFATATDVSSFDLLGGEGSVDYIGFKRHSYASRFAYNSVNENNIAGLLSSASSKGLQTSEYASISSPFDMFFTFHQGSSDQSADDSLVTIAENNGFKIQNDYYTGSQPYWSPNHRLLDTAYTVMKFTIEADQTTIPEVEYVIRGKVLECHNYDGTFVQDKVLGASDAATNFKNGSTCNVEVSTDGSSWITIEDDATPFVDGGTDKVFRVVHNYSYYNSDGVQETRIRLDSVPNLNYGTDGIATYPYVRLKSGSNEWHMLSHNAGTVSTAVNFPDLFISPSSMSTNSSGVLSATFTTTNANTLKNVFGSNTETVYNIGSLTGTILEGNENTVFFGTWSGNTITFRGTFDANETVTGVKVASARVYDLSSNSSVNALTNANSIVGETLRIVETGEERTVTAFDTTNKYVSLDAPFTQVVTSNNKFTINGRGKDLRATTNPAIQTLDYITNKRYGKDLNRYTELDLPSFKASALLCDTRSDVTLTLTSNQSCVKGDVYKLVDTQSNHVASGQVLANTSSTNTVTFTAVSGKFFRQYFNYVLYTIGDFVIHEDKVYEVTTAGFKNTAPTHSSGTTNGFKYLSSVTLTRESGTGPSSLSLATNGTLPQYSLYDSDFIKYWRYLGWESHDQEWVTRHQTNFTLDTSKSIFANVNALLSHFNGILTYSNGKYELNVETQVDAPVESISNGIQSNPLHIKNEDIIGNISLVDNTQRTSKNTIKASLSDPQNNWGSRSISFFNSDFLKADRNVIKTGSFPFTGITNYYNGRINVEKELVQSRFSKEISFTVGQRGLLLKAGEVISISYSPFNFTNKRFRIENLTFNANCTVSVKAREYDDSIYAITPQRASIAHAAQTGANPSLEKPGAPTSLTTTNNKPGVVTVSWNNATDFSAASDYTEIFRHTSDSQANATLLATISDAVTFNDVVADAGTFYYWVRHKRNSSLTNTNKTILLTGDYNASAGVSGVAKTLSAQLDVDVSSIQVKFNDSDVLTPSGTAQDVKLSATLRNITPDSSGVIFTLLDTDQTSQTDVQFTNGAVTLSDTSSPYEATVDASSFSVASTNKFVKVQVTDTSGELFTELVPISITKDGSSGSIGVSAAAVKLDPSSSVITYSANDPDSENPSTTILFTTDLQGNTGTSSSAFSGAPFYEFLVDGSPVGSILSSGTRTIDSASYAFNAFRLPQASEPGDGETVEVQVKVRDGATNGTIKASDSVTIFGIKSGSDSTTAFLTNSAHVVSTASNGSGASFTNAGGTFKVFVGSTDKTSNCTYTVQSETGVDVSIDAGTGAYTIGSMSADIGTAVLRATIPASVSPTGTGFTIDQTYTIAKSKAGTAGAAGTDAKVVTLTADKSAVIYNSSGSSPTPSGNITFTALTKNFTHPRFRFILDGTTGSFSSGNGDQRSGDNIYESDTGVFSIPSSHFTTPKQFTVQVAENGAESTIVAFDSLNVVGLKAATDGTVGVDAHTVFNTNSAHTFPAANNGTVANADEPAGATTIQVYRGTTQLTYAASGGGAGTNTYDVSVSTTGITLAASTVSNQRVFTPTAVSASKGTATFTITAGGLTFTSVYTFSKSIKGDTGEDGDNAQAVTLSASSQIFELAKNSATLSPSSITLTANRQNISNSTTFSTNPSVTLGGSGDTATLSNSNFGNNTAVTVTATAGSFSDSITIVKVEEGTDALTAVLGNESHTFQANNAGTVSDFSGGTTTLQVFEGATALTFTTGTAGNGQFTVSRSASGITQSGFSGNTTTTCTTIAPTAMSGDNATITYTIAGKRANGTAFSLSKVQSFAKSKTGAEGADGNSVALVAIYKQQSYTAAVPTISGTSNYDFTNSTLTSIPSGWSTTIPTFSLYQSIYESEVAVSGTGTSNTVTWPTPVLYNPFFDLNPKIFKRSASQPDTPGVAATNPPTGWSATIPTGSDPVWESVGTWAYNTSGSTYSWSTPVKITGDTGAPGASAASLSVSSNIQTFSFDNSSDTTPTPATATITVNQQNQASNLVTGDITVTNGTKSSFSYSGNNGTGVATVTVTPTGTYPITVAVSNDSLSDNVQITKVTGGDDGNNDPRSAFITIFNPSDATSGVTLPTDTTSGTPYNFETAVLTVGSGGTSGWVTTRPSSRPYWTAQVRIKETTAYEGSQTIDYLLAERIGGIFDKDPGDWVINWDDTNNRLQLEIDSTVVSQPTYPTKLRNDEIIDGTGNIKDTVGLALPSGGGTFSPTEFKNLRASFDNIGNSATIQLQATKVPIDDTNFFKVDSGEIKFGDSITYTGKITAGSGNNVAILDGADSTYRIYAGDSTAADAKFSVTQTGEVYAEQVFIGSTSGLAMGVSTGNNRFQVFTPSGTGSVLEVGGDSASTYVPLKVKNDGTGEIRGFDIFTSGGTKLFDASTGFTDAAFTEIAQATGASVSSISKTSSGDTNDDGQKISLTTGQTVTVKAQKSAVFAGIGINHNGNSTLALSTAYSRIPDSVTIKVLHNTSNSRSGASQVGGTLNFSQYISGTQSATQYQLDQQVETEPGFAFAEVELVRANHSNSSMSQSFSASGSGVGAVGAGTASFTSDGNFTLEFTHTIGTGDNYYWIEIGGSGSFGTGTVGDVTDDSAIRTLTLTAASGSTFNVSDGDGNESSDDVNNATITTAAGNGLTGGGDFTTNQGVAETITFNIGQGTGISVGADAVSLATAGAGAGTYGSTANGTKIDQITLDAYGRVTNVTTGATGTSSSNFYLDGISKSGNTLTFSVNGASNQTYTFGSNAFNSTTIPSLSGYATESYVGTQINNLIDGAPGTLNTLNELAAALDDDSDFHTAVTTSLTGKLSLTGGAMTGAITTNSTFDGRNVSVDGAKLDTIATNADVTPSWVPSTNPNYVTSSGNTIIGTDTDLNTSGAEVVDQINVTDGVIQSMSKRTLTLANLGYTGATNANNYVLPTNLAGDDINIDTGALTGATVISDLDFNITTNTSGLVTDANASVATRTLTLANLGYTGATNADVTPSWVPSSNPNYLTSIAANSIGAAELNVSGNGTAGYVLKSDGDGSFTWTANAISSYTDSGDNRVITSTGSTGINAEYALNYDRVNGLKVHNHNGTGGLSSVATLTLGKSPFNSGISNLILDSKSQGSIKFQDGSTTDASITYDGVISNKLSITSGTIRLSGAVETTSTLSTGRVTASGTGTAGVPTLDIINSSSSTFNHSIEAMTPNLTAGESNILVFGRAGSTKNSGYIGYKYSSAGSNDNVITIGHWSSNHLVTINGAGNTTFAGTISSGEITTTAPQFKYVSNTDSNVGLLIRDETYISNEADITASRLAAGNNLTLGLAGQVGINAYIGGVNKFSINSSGNATFAGTISNSAFTIPNSIGTAGQVLKVPSSGTTLEWGTVSGGSGLPSGMTYSSSILDVTGAIRATGDVTAFHSSDERLKDNITVIDSALAKVKQLRGVEFDWNDKQDLHKGHDIGVIAQDVEQVAPELVRDREDGYKAVDYPKLTALLIEAIKELELKVKELEDKQK